MSFGARLTTVALICVASGLGLMANRSRADQSSSAAHKAAKAEPNHRPLSGKWTGVTVTGNGTKSEVFVELAVNEDGTVTGTWGGVPRDVLTIAEGERVNSELLQWESWYTPSHHDSHWRVRCKVVGDGQALLLDYTFTMKKDGKVVGDTGASVLTRQE